MFNKSLNFVITAIILGISFYFIKNGPQKLPFNNYVNNFQSCLNARYAILESYPRQCQTPDGRIFIEDLGNQIEKNDLIQLSEPQANQVISTPLLVKGQARGKWYFEASFPIEVWDANKNVLGTGLAQAQGDWMTLDFVPFEAWVNFNIPQDSSGYLVLKKDNPSGDPQLDDQLIIPIIFSQEKMSIKVFWTTAKTAGAEDFNCQYVEAVSYSVPKSIAVARAAVLALLQGPSIKEKTQGYDTAINSGVKINSLVIEDGVAKIDFDQQIQDQVGGSCRVATIRAQIEKTLKQFPTIKSVIISVNGDAEQSLQP